MHRCLIVANLTLGGDHLLEEVRGRMAAGPVSFFVLVPAAFPHDAHFHTEGAAIAGARRRLDAELARLRLMGVDADGAIGSQNPRYAVEDLLREEEFDEIILSTLPSGVSRWLRQDLPHRLARVTTTPITLVVAPAETPIGVAR